MPLSTWLVGQTYPIWQFTITDQAGNAIPLTNVVAANITLIFRNTETGVVTSGGGTFLVLNAAAGIITYTEAAADVATPGTYDIEITIPIPSAGNLMRKYPGWVLQR